MMIYFTYCATNLPNRYAFALGFSADLKNTVFSFSFLVKSRKKGLVSKFLKNLSMFCRENGILCNNTFAIIN